MWEIVALVVGFAVLCGLLSGLFWLSCRLGARTCPNCGSGWRTELQGEWGDEEDWKCHACGHLWGHKLEPFGGGSEDDSGGGTAGFA